jgi:hypothetical protein
MNVLEAYIKIQILFISFFKLNIRGVQIPTPMFSRVIDVDVSADFYLARVAM